MAWKLSRTSRKHLKIHLYTIALEFGIKLPAWIQFAVFKSKAELVPTGDSIEKDDQGKVMDPLCFFENEKSFHEMKKLPRRLGIIGSSLVTPMYQSATDISVITTAQGRWCS
jgi:hypothetical protein